MPSYNPCSANSCGCSRYNSASIGVRRLFGFHIFTLTHIKMSSDFFKICKTFLSCLSSRLRPDLLLECFLSEANCLWLLEVLCVTAFQWPQVTEIPYCCNRFFVYGCSLNIRVISSLSFLVCLRSPSDATPPFFCLRCTLFLFFAVDLMTIIRVPDPQMLWPVI